MKSTRSLIYLILSCFLTCYACKNTQRESPTPAEPTIAQADAIPADAIPFHYTNNKYITILIDAVLNGTDSIAVIWDTGYSNIELPTVYKDRLSGKDSLCLKVGNSMLTYKGEIRFSNAYILKDGENRIIAGPDLFRDKIVEISYDRKYLRVLPDTDGLKGYECIPYRVDKYFYIPITVYTQGKIFRIEDARLDTGFNGALIAYEKSLPGVDLHSADTIYAGRPGQKKDAVSQISADSIQAGSLSARNMKILIVPNKNYIPDNLLGNGFFSHFSVVFDFKNKNLYLKPLGE